MKDCMTIENFTVTPEIMEVLTHWFGNDKFRKSMTSINDDMISTYMDALMDVNDHILDVLENEHDRQKIDYSLEILKTIKELRKDINKMHASKLSLDYQQKIMNGKNTDEK